MSRAILSGRPPYNGATASIEKGLLVLNRHSADATATGPMVFSNAEMRVLRDFLNEEAPK